MADLANTLSVATPPDRRAGSVRRTVSLQCGFPDGAQGDIRIVGTGRDLYTAGAPDDVAVVATQRVDIIVSQSGRCLAFRDFTANRDLDELEGIALGRPWRQAAGEQLTQEMESCSLLARMIAEIPAIAFLSRGAWHTWLGDQQKFIELFGPSSGLDRPVEGLCISYAPGSIALSPQGTPNEKLLKRRKGYFPRHPSDPWDWHDFDRLDGPEFTRIRYTDVWLADQGIELQSAFQDSAVPPVATEERGLYHEYCVTARLAEETHALAGIDVITGSLPFTTCLRSPHNVQRLVGRSADEFGKLVPTELGGVAGCTHLNETLKTLQDVPALARTLRSLNPDGRAAPASAGAQADV